MQAFGEKDLPGKLAKLRIGYRKDLKIYGRIIDCVNHTHSLAPEYMDAIDQLETPTSLKSLYSVLGHIPRADQDAPQIYNAAAPLYKLLSDDTRAKAANPSCRVNFKRLMDDNPDCVRAVQDIKALFKQATSSHVIDPSPTSLIPPAGYTSSVTPASVVPVVRLSSTTLSLASRM